MWYVKDANHHSHHTARVCRVLFVARIVLPGLRANNSVNATYIRTIDHANLETSIHETWKRVVVDKVTDTNSGSSNVRSPQC